VGIVEGTLPPILTTPPDQMPIAAGGSFAFDVSAESPEGFPVTLDMESFTAYDSEDVEPTTPATFTGGNPGQFSWYPSTADVGIWKATFKTCDTTGACVTKSVRLQVVASAVYLLDFVVSESPDVLHSSGMCHGNFDSDPETEVFLAGTVLDHHPAAQLYDWVSGSFVMAYQYDHSGFPTEAPRTGFIDDDSNLDVVAMSYGPGPAEWELMVFTGDGSAGFNIIAGVNDGDFTREITIQEFTGDEHIDAASIHYDGIHIFAGNGQGGFVSANTISTPDSMASINSADFNNDGIADLAVGGKSGLHIYLGDGTGGFTLAHSYSQTYGTLAIQVTNKGSDFNGDDIFDLCISTPSVGGTESEMMVYLGNGDGSFTQQAVRSVNGQIFGNCVGDFNGDLLLDIGFVNGAEKYAAILYGNGAGSFVNEVRYDIPHANPEFVDAIDVDLDGDLDLVVMANQVNGSNSLFALLNQLDPAGFAGKAVKVAVCNNADVELRSAGNRVFNRLRNTMPSGDFYERRIDADAIIDIQFELGVVESGRYLLAATPKPNLTRRETFSIEFTVDGQCHRLARDLAMSEDGYVFGIYADAASPILPRPGAFSMANPPSFAWPGEGEYDFQLATDIEFTNLLANSTVSGSEYSHPAALPVTDTSSYFWRVKPHERVEFECIYVLNLVLRPQPGCGDVNDDQVINVSDIVYMVVFVFGDGPPPDPVEKGDVDCDGNVNVADVVYLINYVFGSGPPPCADCP
jgi:hypothetical protein